jgi:dipeptidyl-peptidase-4
MSTFVHFKPATQEVVCQRYPKAGQANPRVRLGIVEVSSQKTTWIDCGEYEYLDRFKWLPESKKIAVQTLNRRQSELKLFIADRKSGRFRKILTETQPAWINLNDSPYFLGDGKRFIWLSERDGYQHLYLYSMDGQLIRQLTKGDFMVLHSEKDLVSGNGGLEGIDEQGWVYFTSNKHALKERHLYRIRLDGSGLERLTQESGVHVVSFSPKGRYFLDAFSDSSTSPSLSLHRADGEKLGDLVPSAGDLLQGLDIPFPEYQAFPVDDGLHLPAMMTKPLDFSPSKKYPAIIYVYGGPGSQQVIDRWRDRWLWHSLLAQEGFLVFVFEVRTGMGKSKALETSVYGRAYGMQNVKDILAGVRWLQSMPFVDQERLGIWGASGGGCTTLYTMTHCDVFKTGIAKAPVSDWHFYDTIYTERYQGTPQDNPEGYRETSSVLAASNLKGKLLVIHGTYDDNVHPQNTYAFINQLIEHNMPFELMIYPWRKHGFRDKAANVHYYTLMLDFWRKNL